MKINALRICLRVRLFPSEMLLMEYLEIIPILRDEVLRFDDAFDIVKRIYSIQILQVTCQKTAIVSEIQQQEEILQLPDFSP